MTSKQRAYLKGLAMNLNPSFNIGKDSLTTGVVDAMIEALEANELIKVGVLKNCEDDPKELAVLASDRTHAEVVQVIGKKIVLYRPATKKENRKIILPKANV